MLKVKLFIFVLLMALLMTACGDYPPGHPCNDPLAYSIGACS